MSEVKTYKWITYHVIFFVITLIFNYVFNFYFKIPEGRLLSYTIFFAVDYAILIGYFYCMLYISKFVLRRMFLFIPFLFVCLFFVTFIFSFVPYHFYKIIGFPTPFIEVYFFKLFEMSYMTISSIGFLFLQNWDESTGQKMQLIESNSEAELTFLRSQMSPHFLLNTLNSVYSLALKKSPETYTAIGELKTIYSYIQKSDGKVSLKTEIEYLDNFIKIQKRRYGEAIVLHVSFTIDQDYQIEPLLLSSFIENAFKHGVSMKEQSFITIKLRVSEGKLRYVVYNSDHASIYKDATSGIGLQNLLRRLELLYPEKFSLEYFRKEKTFTSILTIEKL